MGAFDKTLSVGAQGAASKVFEQPVKLVNPDGTDFAGGGPSYTLPAASADALGGVKQQVFEGAIGSADEGIATAAAAPTQEEHNALVGAYNDLAKQFNRLIGGLKATGIIAVRTE